MSYADEVFIANCKDILETAHGTRTTTFARTGRTARARTR